MAREISDKPEGSDIKQLERELIQANPTLFKGIPEGKRKEILQVLAVMTYKSHSGPIPPPEDLREYNEIIPNGADRIMTMAEQQQNHRIEIEKKVIGRQTFQSQVGQIFALVIGLTAILTSAYVVINGHDWGVVLGAGGIIGLVQAFIQGKKEQNKSLAQKNR